MPRQCKSVVNQNVFSLTKPSNHVLFLIACLNASFSMDEKNWTVWEDAGPRRIISDEDLVQEDPAMSSTAAVSRSAEELQELKDAIPGLFDLIPNRLLKK